MRSIAPLVMTALFAFAAAAAAQNPPAAPAKPQAVPADQVRTLPIASLPDSLADASFGLDVKLPGGFALAPNLETQRKVMRAEFDKQELPESATMKPRQQLWLYSNEAGAAIAVVAAEVLLQPISSPATMADKLNTERRSSGVTVNPIGEPKFFKARDAHVGFMIEREVSLARGGPILKHEVWGYVRAGGREVMVYLSAPLLEFTAREKEFLAMFATIQLAEIETAPIAVSAASVTVPKTSPGFSDPFTIGVLVLCLGALALLAKVLRSPAAAT